MTLEKSLIWSDYLKCNLTIWNVKCDPMWYEIWLDHYQFWKWNQLLSLSSGYLVNIAELNETKSTIGYKVNCTKIKINRLVLNHTYEVTVLAWTIAGFGNKTRGVYFTMGILFFIKFYTCTSIERELSKLLDFFGYLR